MVRLLHRCLSDFWDCTTITTASCTCPNCATIQLLPRCLFTVNRPPFARSHNSPLHHADTSYSHTKATTSVHHGQLSFTSKHTGQSLQGVPSSPLSNTLALALPHLLSPGISRLADKLLHQLTNACCSVDCLVVQENAHSPCVA